MTAEAMKLKIEEIKELTAQTAPNFFSPETLKFFGQTMYSFSLIKQDDGRYFISAPSYSYINGKRTLMGNTERYFNPINNELEFK